MTRQQFRELCNRNLIFLDGATGSNLIKRGMPAGVCPEEWILNNKETLIGLQREYMEAGSHIVYAPTFTSNRIKLMEYHLEDQIREINIELVKMSKEAVNGIGYVAGDITMTGEQLSPMGSMEFEELVNIYKEQIEYLVEGGVDLLAIETMMSLQESRAALIAAKEVCDLPVIVTLTFESDGRTLFGTDAKTAAIVLSSLGADAIGANCSSGPDKMSAIIREMASVTTIPIIAKPNAGMPSLDQNGNTVYDMNADTFATEMKQIYEAGAMIMGGCCGTTPAHIKALSDMLGTMPVIERVSTGKRYLASERQSLVFGLDDRFMIIGERINPTGKKKLQAELSESKFDMVNAFAEEQELCGASILDVNMGMSGVDEKELMLKALEEVGGVSSLPLTIDTSSVEVMEAALRHYPGRALMNSISLESVKYDNLLPLAKKYGAMFILLPLSDKGLPESLSEKIEIINTITKRALELGMKKEDIIVDGLVTTVGANKKAALETLETIRYCKDHGLATTCGLSNISFGLPERGYINTAFLTMAIREGLTTAIANPNQELLTSCAMASDLLLNKEESDISYINAMNLQKESKTATHGMQETLAKTEKNILEQLHESVLKGNRAGILSQTKAAVEEGHRPSDLLNTILLPAINDVGELFDQGKYFLPQLIASAETMKLSIEYLEPFLMEQNGGHDMPVIVIATVAGDIHDIGKNLVALMLKNHGFKVIDLGKDVKKETIIQTAKEHNASIIALSALMTTTMKEMKHVVDYAKENNIDSKIIIGGAVITQDYADEIGADGYSKDAADAVKLTKRILGITD
ncbi:MAG: homocysteine S-methyltransferase family protein [Lachnospiraceae bacterium]|nr:homocysteine S-methyltransferase family protein [Lachnospiraceae bacterium]